jgi:hypothetical protein
LSCDCGFGCIKMSLTSKRSCSLPDIRYKTSLVSCDSYEIFTSTVSRSELMSHFVSQGTYINTILVPNRDRACVQAETRCSFLSAVVFNAHFCSPHQSFIAHRAPHHVTIFMNISCDSRSRIVVQ